MAICCVLVTSIPKTMRKHFGHAEIWRFFDFFQNGGCPPSWIGYVRVGTTHEAAACVAVATSESSEVAASVVFTTVASVKTITPTS